MLGLDQGGKSPPRDFVRPPAVATLSGARGLLEAPLDDMATHYVCGLRGALGALSLLVEKGKSTFGSVARILARF